MKFAKYAFMIAAIYGLIVLVPQFFLEARTGQDYPPPITHPEFYYGFVGLAVVFQFVFLIISCDPARYRAMMIPSVLEKLSFAIPAFVLSSQGRLSGPLLVFASIDLALGVLFVAAFLKTPSRA